MALAMIEMRQTESEELGGPRLIGRAETEAEVEVELETRAKAETETEAEGRRTDEQTSGKLSREGEGAAARVSNSINLI